MLDRLPLRQALRSLSSKGHAARRLRQSKKPFPVNKIPAVLKIRILFSEAQISPGIFVASPAIIAPNPKLTRSAGRAQHKRVLGLFSLAAFNFFGAHLVGSLMLLWFIGAVAGGFAAIELSYRLRRSLV